MTNEKKKILPVTYPPITTYPAFAATLSILNSYEESYDWMFSHYLQIYAVDKVNRGEFLILRGNAPYKAVFFGDVDNRRLLNANCDFMFFSKETCQYLDIFEVPTELFMTYNETFVSFIKRSIDLNMYVYAYVEQSKIEAFHRDYELNHPLLIFGYDDNEGVVHVADFVSSTYEFFECTYDELENAFQSGLNFPVNVMDLPKESEAIALIRYTDYAPFIFDYSYIQDTIKEYIYPNKSKVEKFDRYIMSRLSFSDQVLKTHMGIDVYQYLSDLIQLEFNSGKEFIDYRIYHAMYDHKEMMIKRIEHFIKKGYLDSGKSALLEEYKKVRDNTLSIRNSILKYNIQKNKGVTDRVVSSLAETRDLEISLLKEIFDVE